MFSGNRLNMSIHYFKQAMTAQAKQTVEGVDTAPPAIENEYEEEETFESVLGRLKIV